MLRLGQFWLISSANKYRLDHQDAKAECQPTHVFRRRRHLPRLRLVNFYRQNKGPQPSAPPVKAALLLSKALSAATRSRINVARVLLLTIPEIWTRLSQKDKFALTLEQVCSA